MATVRMRSTGSAVVQTFSSLDISGFVEFKLKPTEALAALP
jgi:hypothetical protein